MPRNGMFESLGRRIRKTRKQKGFTIAQLAVETGFSKGYISQVERALVNPSISALQKIASVLEMPIAFFLNEEKGLQAESSRVVRADQRKILKYPDSDVRYELVSPDLRRQIEFVYVREPPGTISGQQPFQHEGEELIFVMAGTLEYWIGDEKYVLEKGDAIWHLSSVPHRWRVVGDKELEAVAAIVPPSF